MYVLGVDGGGTKTVCLLVDEQRRVVGRGVAGPSNRYAVGDATAEAELCRAITAALADGGLAGGDIAAVCLGMAGVDRPGDAPVVEAMVRRVLPAPRILVHNDAIIALAGGVGRLYGVVIIAGTGAIAYGVNARGERRRAGGWGHLLGDEGSGYHTGLAALRAVLRAHDGRGPTTALRDLILAEWGLARPEDLVGLVYSPNFPKRQIAGLLPLVDRAAAQGDAVARALLGEAGRELGLAAAAVIRGLGMEAERFEVVLAGGAFQVKAVLRESVKAAVAAAAPLATVIDPRHEPAMGAALLALEAVAGC